MKKFDLVMGIDPGANGAISHIKNDVVTAVKMPKDFMQIVDYFKHLKSISENPICMIEKVSVRPGDERGGKIFRVQSMMRNYNELINALKVADIKFIEVYPQTWQSVLRLKKKIENEQLDQLWKEAILKSGKESKAARSIQAKIKSKRKNRYKMFAQNIFPEIKCTLANCDALLLLQFAKVQMNINPDYFL